MSSLGFATGLSMVIGPIIGGCLSSIGTLALPFYVSIILLILFGILMIFLLPNTKNNVATLESASKSTTSKKFLSFQLFGWLVAGCSVMFVVVGLQLLTSLYLHDAIGQSIVQSAKTASLLFVILGVSLMIIQIAQIKFFNWTAKQMMTRSILLIILGLLLIVLTRDFILLLISYIVIGAGAGLGMSSLSAGGASLVVSQDNQGSAAGAVAMTQGIAGGIVSPLLGSFVYQINIKLPFIIFALFALFAYILFLFSNKKETTN